MYICVCVWFMFIYLATHVHATIVVDTWSSSGPGHRLPTPPLPTLMRSWLLLTVPCRGICEGSIKHTSFAMLCGLGIPSLGPKTLIHGQKECAHHTSDQLPKDWDSNEIRKLDDSLHTQPPQKIHIINIYIYISYIWYVYIYRDSPDSGGENCKAIRMRNGNYVENGVSMLAGVCCWWFFSFFTKAGLATEVGSIQTWRKGSLQSSKKHSSNWKPTAFTRLLKASLCSFYFHSFSLSPHIKQWKKSLGFFSQKVQASVFLQHPTLSAKGTNHLPGSLRSLLLWRPGAMDGAWK